MGSSEDGYWFIERDGKPDGPYSADALMALIRSGSVAHQQRVWRTGTPAWRPASEVSGLEEVPSLPPAGSATTPQRDTPSPPSEPPHVSRGPTQRPTQAVAQTKPAPHGRRGYLGRHWRGE